MAELLCSCGQSYNLNSQGFSIPVVQVVTAVHTSRAVWVRLDLQLQTSWLLHAVVLAHVPLTCFIQSDIVWLTVTQQHFRFAVPLSRLAAFPHHSLHSQIKSCQRVLHKWRMQVRFLCFKKLFWETRLQTTRIERDFLPLLRNRPRARQGQELLKFTWINPRPMQARACLQNSIHYLQLPTARM